MKTTVFIILLALIIQGCSKPLKKDSAELYSNIENITSKKHATTIDITLDTIIVDNQFSTSGDGFWRIRNDTLYFFDRVMGEVSVFDKNGKFLWDGLGLGRGPGEVLEEIGNVCPFKDGWFLTEVYNVYHFNSNFGNKKMKFLIDFGDDFESRRQELYANPNPMKDIELYVPAYENPQMHQLDGNTVLLKVSCEYPDYAQKEYYDQSAIMAEYDFEKGTITKLMARYSPAYKDKIVPAFASHYYSPYKNGQYLLTFAIDHKIYITNEDFEPKTAFGLKGQFLNEDYIQKAEMSYPEMLKELENKAYYTSIYHSEPHNLTFRVYKTGQNNKTKNAETTTNPSRMQIYQGTDLIGDISVPDNFEIINYKAPYYYADGYEKIGEERDYLGVYRFKVDME
jgi:hypothetical protein